MSTDWFDRGLNPYEILGIGEDAQQATTDEIKKVFRKLAIVKHPDKNPNNPNAAAEFALLDEAYRALLDPAARGVVDDWLRARNARRDKDKGLSDKRRKLKEELDKREREAVSGRNEEEMALMRLRSELERLRKRAQDERRQQAVESAATAATAAAAAAAAVGSSYLNASFSAASTSAPCEDHQDAHLRRSLKVTWDPIALDYSSEQIRNALSIHGRVEEVVIKERKKRNKATALVVMSNQLEAESATASVCGNIVSPLLVTPLMKLVPQNKPASKDYVPAPEVLAMPSVVNKVVINGTSCGSVMPSSKGLLLSDPPSSAPLFPVAQMSGASGAKPLFPSMSKSGGQGHSYAAGTRVEASSSFPSFQFNSYLSQNGAPRPTPSVSNFEASVFEKMKREEERRRALRAAESEAD